MVATAVFETRALTPWPGEVVQNLGEMMVVLVAEVSDEPNEAVSLSVPSLLPDHIKDMIC